MTPKIQPIKVDAMRHIAVEVAGDKVRLSLVLAGINAYSQLITPQASRALGAALLLAGRDAEQGGAP